MVNRVRGKLCIVRPPSAVKWDADTFNLFGFVCVPPPPTPHAPPFPLLDPGVVTDQVSGVEAANVSQTYVSGSDGSGGHTTASSRDGRTSAGVLFFPPQRLQIFYFHCGEQRGSTWVRSSKRLNMSRQMRLKSVSVWIYGGCRR